MDEEFIGGTTLQGSCSNFRGKLCVWAHLLKVTPENSKVLVNKIVPKQSGAKGYDKIIETVESDSLGGKGGASASNKKAALVENGSAPAQQQHAWSQPQGKGGIRAKTPQKEPESQKKATRTEGMQKKKGQNAGQGSRAGSTGRAASAGRAASSGRGKQGAWKEARGPSAKGVGFKGPGKRGPSTGLNRWKKVVGTKSDNPGKKVDQASAAAPSSNGAGQKAMELKAILGVQTPSAAPPAAPVSMAPSTAAGLKALLGVGGPPADQGPSLDQIPDPPMPPAAMMAQGPSPPPSAADKLFAMMRAKQQPQGPAPGPMYPAAPQPSSFNFTYVEEGKAPPPQMQPPQQMMPPPQQMMPPQMMGHHPMPMQFPPMNAYSYGYPPGPPPAHMMPPPPAHMHSPPAPPQNPGPSDVDFPPLGASGPSKDTGSTKAAEAQSAAPAPAKPSVMVPAVVASKAKK